MHQSYCPPCMPVCITSIESNRQPSATGRSPPDPMYTLIDKTSCQPMTLIKVNYRKGDTSHEFAWVYCRNFAL